MPSPDTSRMHYPVYTGMRTAGPRFVPWLGFLAAPVVLGAFALLDLSLVGYLYGLALFALNRLAAVLTDRVARGKMEVTAVGITGVGFISRAWIAVAILFAIARLGGRDIGLAAALCFLALFTVDMLTRSLAHLIGREAAKASQELA